MSRVATELERAGLVERQANPDDKRSSFALITPDGAPGCGLRVGVTERSGDYTGT